MAEDAKCLTTRREVDKHLSRVKEARYEIYVNIPELGGLRNCYLGTPNMKMRYQSLHEPIIYGNLSLTWELRHDHHHQGARLISNSVTDEANVKPLTGEPRTYLTVKNQIQHEHHLQAEGNGSPFYFDGRKGEDGQTYVAIYTKIRGKKVYLQPSSNEEHPYTIIAADGPPKYIFKIEEEIKDGRRTPSHLSIFFHYANEQRHKLLVLSTLGIATFASIAYLAIR